MKNLFIYFCITITLSSTLVGMNQSQNSHKRTREELEKELLSGQTALDQLTNQDELKIAFDLIKRTENEAQEEEAKSPRFQKADSLLQLLSSYKYYRDVPLFAQQFLNQAEEQLKELKICNQLAAIAQQNQRQQASKKV